MDFATIDGVFNRYKAAQLNREIHPDDVMFNSGKNFYFTVGEDAVRVILRAMSLTWRTDVLRVLDLPCGHGRVARHLPAAFPKAEFFFCDIDKEGVDFCAKQFGGTGIYSEPDLTRVALPKNLDVAWMGSLFTHVDRHRAAAWLAPIASHLSDKAVLVATFRGLSQKSSSEFGGSASHDALIRDFERTGYGFAVYKEWQAENYGTTLVRPSAVVAIAEQIPGMRILSYTEKGWANRQDVLVICRHERVDA